MINKINTKPIYGYESQYVVSDCGRVFNVNYRGSGLVRELKLSKNEFGYFVVSLWKNGVGKKKKVHHLVLESFNKPKPEGMVCRHLDGCKTNNNIFNLTWGTQAENIKDKSAHGTNCKGESRYNSKLSNKLVREIRAKYSSGRFSQRGLAKNYNISQSVLCDVVNFKRWKHLD